MQKPIKQRVICSVGAALVAVSAMFMLPGSSASAHELEAKIPSIHVNGTGVVSVKPDIAILSLGVLRQAKTARAALDENTKSMAAVIESMKAEGIAAKDLQTSGFNISPRYFYPQRNNNNGEQPPPKIVGYDVSNNLTVKVRDLTKVGQILDKVITLGVNSGGSIQFSNDDPSEIIEKARIMAVENAMSKAKTLTGAAQVGLKRILSISENGSQPRPVPLAQARSLRAESVASDSVPVEAGENQYRVSVSVSWEIDQ